MLFPEDTHVGDSLVDPASTRDFPEGSTRVQEASRRRSVARGDVSRDAGPAWRADGRHIGNCDEKRATKGRKMSMGIFALEGKDGDCAVLQKPAVLCCGVSQPLLVHPSQKDGQEKDSAGTNVIDQGCLT